jgi:two-component sensor histidine kinase/Tfp pilus assembly protein PilF
MSNSFGNFLFFLKTRKVNLFLYIYDMKFLQYFLFFSALLYWSSVFGQLSNDQKLKLDSLKKIIEESEYDTLVARSYLDLTEILYTVNFDTVVTLCQKSVEICERNLNRNITKSERLSLKKTLAGALNNIGYIYDDQGKVVEALEYYHKSLTIREELDDTLGIAISLNNIGIIYVNQGELDYALSYYLKSLNYKEVLGNKKNIATSLNNIAGVYRKKGDLNKALYYYKRSLYIREELGSKRGVSISLNNIGTVYNKMNSLDTALSYYQRSLFLSKELGDKRGTANRLCSVGSVYLRKGNIELSKDFGLESLNLAKELGFSERIKDAANLLARIYKKEENWKDAFIMQDIYYKMRDSIRNEETELASVREQAKYQINVVEKEKALLSKEADINELKLNRNRIVSWFFIAALFFAIVLIFFTYRGYRKKNLINELLKKQKDEVSKSNEVKNAMLKEIHHRVKNNLQVVSSLLSLQSYEIEDEKVLAMFEESKNRILSMAHIHEQLYRSDDLKEVNVEHHFTELIKELIKDYQIDTKIGLNIDIMHEGLGVKTLVPLGLIINEMISNSLKYAFKGVEEGMVIVNIKHLEGVKYEMLIGDNGIGMVKDYDIENSTTLGTQLIQTFTSQLNGSIERVGDTGTLFRILFEEIDNI